MIKPALGCVALCWWLVASTGLLQAHQSLADVYDMKKDTVGSATALAQRGIGRTGENALHNGDSIKVKFRPAKDGSPLGFLETETMPDGRVISIAAPNATE